MRSINSDIKGFILGHPVEKVGGNDRWIQMKWINLRSQW